MMNSCGNCKFWDHGGADNYDGNDDDEAFSDCRRFPPPMGHYADVGPNFTSRFPVTLAMSWCGEWAKDESAQSDASPQESPQDRDVAPTDAAEPDAGTTPAAFADD